MSEPKRLEFIKSADCDMGCDCRLIPDPIECKDGRFVFYRDYARLKAEVERLTKFNDEALAHIAKEERKSRECLDMAQAEVERLRKAGDALYESEIGYYGEQILVDPKHHSGELCRNWNAAKEGKGQP